MVWHRVVRQREVPVLTNITQLSIFNKKTNLMFNQMFKFLSLSVALIFSQVVHAAPEIQTWKTSQGIPVYFVNAPELPMIDINIVFDAGSSRDADQSGLAMLTTGLLSQGAAGMNADQISQGFESLGAVYGSDTGYDSSSVSLRSLTDKTLLDAAMANFKKVIAQPDFPEEALERRRSRTLIGIRSKQQSPGSLARDAFMGSVFKNHPYALPNEGTEESIKAITRNDVSQFHQQYFVANNAMIAMVGAVDTEQAKAIAEELGGVFPQGEKPAVLPNVNQLQQAETVFIEHPSQQTHILIGQPGVKRGDPDHFALYVGNHVLGGGGMVSRLFEEVREKRGLSYSAYSYFSPLRFKGPFIAGLQTKTEQVEEAKKVLMENIQRFIDQGPTEAELEASKKNITGGYPLRIDSNGKILSYVTVIGYYGLPLDYLETFNDKVSAVTIEDIKDAFKRRLSPDKMITVMVGTPEQEDS